MGFMPSKADPCIWMREIQKLKCYEYVATYVDDLCIAARNPGKIIQTLKAYYNVKVKGDGPLHLILVLTIPGTRTRLLSVEQRSTLTGWLIPTIHPKNEDTSGQE